MNSETIIVKAIAQMEKLSGFIAKSPNTLYNNIYVPDMSNNDKWAEIELELLTDFRLGRYKFKKDKSRFNRSRKLKMQCIDPDKVKIVGRNVNITVTLDELKKIWEKSVWKIL